MLITRQKPERCDTIVTPVYEQKELLKQREAPEVRFANGVAELLHTISTNSSDIEESFLMKKWIQTLLTLFLIIAVSVVIIRTLTGSETLADYAKNNPETAYATPEVTPIDADDTSADSPDPSTSADPDALAASSSPNASADLAAAAAPTAASSTQTAATDHLAGTSAAPDGVNYKDGFYYEPLPEEIIDRISGISYPISTRDAASSQKAVFHTVEDPASLQVQLEDLRYLRVLYYDFDGNIQSGELICNQKIAQDLIEIFYELYEHQYPFERIELIDTYNGDDTASMLANNTSCFNYRTVDNSSSLSNHALGLAIDINPFYNPYVVKKSDGSTYISPAGSEIYADRTVAFPHKIDENDLCYQLFIEHGFFWGGNWENQIDYQHFQKVS